MGTDLERKISEVKSKLLDPFFIEDLEKDFRELYEILRSSTPEEATRIREEFEEVRRLLLRNLSIIAGGLKPILERGEGGLFSRRV